MSKKRSRDSDSYVIFGFRIESEDDTGYIGNDGLRIVRNLSAARVFKSLNEEHKKGYASPEKWLEFYNEEKPEWKFHLVKINHK